MLLFKFESLIKRSGFLAGTLGVVIVLIISISLFSFINIKENLLKVSSADIPVILKNSSHSRDIAKLYSDINILKLTFLGKNDFLNSEGLRLTEKINKIIEKTDDRKLKTIQIEFLTSFNVYIDQYCLSFSSKSLFCYLNRAASLRFWLYHLYDLGNPRSHAGLSPPVSVWLCRWIQP